MTNTYTVTVTFTTDEDTDEHLRTSEAIEEEVRAWLEGLKADVTTVTVEAA